MLYLGLPLKTVWKLQLMQNATAHILIGANRIIDHITPILQALCAGSKFLSCAQCKVLVLIYNDLPRCILRTIFSNVFLPSHLGHLRRAFSRCYHQLIVMPSQDDLNGHAKTH